jgi:excisionase family DNA binding protein
LRLHYFAKGRLQESPSLGALFETHSCRPTIVDQPQLKPPSVQTDELGNGNAIAPNIGGNAAGWVSLKELVELTGLSESTLRRRVKDGSIPVTQLGGQGKKLLFPRDVVDLLASPRCGRHQEACNIHDEPANTVPSLTSQSLAPAAPAASGHTGEAPSRAIGLHRPESGPIPNWMRSPLLDRPKSPHDQQKK